MTDTAIGIRPVTAEMPYGPEELHFPHFDLPGPSGFGHWEQDEVATRLIFICQQEGGWVGITYEEFFERWRLEQLLVAERTAAFSDTVNAHYKPYHAALDRHRILMRRRRWLNPLTLGLLNWLSPKPTAPTAPAHIERTDSVPFCGSAQEGAAFLARGINELEERGILQVERVGDGIHPHDTFYPTVQMLMHLAEGPFRVSSKA